MKTIFTFITFTLFSAYVHGQYLQPLYPIIQGQLWGYMDSTGTTVIQPRFLNAGPFSEGIAPVRLHGTYGYIDASGSFALSPTYDLALSFSNGLAKVFIEGKPFMIDTKGRVLFEHPFNDFLGFGDRSYAIVKTHTDKYGVIDKTGRLVADTAFANISSFNNGVAVVTGLNHAPYSGDSTRRPMYEMGVIDSLGNWIVPYGRYKHIQEYHHDYAQVELMVPPQKGFYDYKGIIDRQGRYRFTIPAKKWHLDYRDSRFHEGIAVVCIYSVDPETVAVWSSAKRYDYKGAVNANGELLFSNPNWDELTPFSFNRAFARQAKGNWYLVDTRGNKVVPQPFNDILYRPYQDQTGSLFEGGTAFVKTTAGWEAIDTTGKVVVEPLPFLKGKNYQLIRRGNLVFLQEDISTATSRYPYRYGFWDTRTNKVVDPQFHAIQMEGDLTGLIQAMQDGNLCYVDANGTIVWQETQPISNALRNLNIDFMNRGYFYAYAKPDKTDLGGFGGSENTARKMKQPDDFPSQQLSVVVHPEWKDTFGGSYHAITVCVGNRTGKKVKFDAQDSRLYMTVQARTPKGEWKDIEYSPSSWCGNSYHTLTLEPNQYWKFITPVYEGALKTKLRIALTYLAPTSTSTDDRKPETRTVYSNEYDGSVNPGQFWNKQSYQPAGIMDPYND